MPNRHKSTCSPISKLLILVFQNVNNIVLSFTCQFITYFLSIIPYSFVSCQFLKYEMGSILVPLR